MFIEECAIRHCRVDQWNICSITVYSTKMRYRKKMIIIVSNILAFLVQPKWSMYWYIFPIVNMFINKQECLDNWTIATSLKQSFWDIFCFFYKINFLIIYLNILVMQWFSFLSNMWLLKWTTAKEHLLLISMNESFLLSRDQRRKKRNNYGY
jgi:hypothetical protein